LGARLFSLVNDFRGGDVQPGLCVVTGHVMEGVSMAEAEAALWAELERMKTEPVGDYELEKVKNKFEANDIFGQINVLNKAMNLAYFEMLGDAAMINDEVAEHNSVTRDEIQAVSRRVFRPANSSTLLYLAEEAQKQREEER
ncbi:MAG: insulinase family protein, partial [Rikenella sp.]|nr:insulinase family protein [Rikenella sp.]